jgi:hypothetical protein
MKPLSQQWPKVEYSVTHLGAGQSKTGQPFPGGLDLTTPSLSLQPGAIRAGQNFECAQSGGYSRIAGYERLDGRLAPSMGAYTLVQFSAFTNVPAVGDTLTQATSGATGTVIIVNNAPGAVYVALTQVSGTFDLTHNVTKSGPITIGIPIAPTVSLTSKQSAQYTAAAADVYRALIGAVPGSGPILDTYHLIVAGVDVVFAFRANLGNTAVNLYKTTGSGWTQVTLFDVVSFTAGTTLPIAGDTLTQGGVTSTIKLVQWQSGTTGASSAAGKLIITTPAGGNYTSGAATSTSGGAFTLSGVQTAITITPGGTWEHDKNNYTGLAIPRKAYGADGVNKGYEFDGVVYAPIATGTSPDTPKHVKCHKNYLVFGFDGSIIGSGPGLPYKWTAADGAWEIATGDTVTAMQTLPGSQTNATLAVFQRNNTSFLYGLDPTTFNYVTFNTGVGALPGSVQNLFDVFAFDTLGVLSLQTTLNYGNFIASTLTKNILPFILQENTKVVCSTTSHYKNQYRVFFSDGYGLYLTVVNRQYLGCIPVQFPNPVSCIDTDNLVNGTEATYFGSSDGNGYVYQLDSGTSFDGAALNAYITLAWDPINTPRVLKRFRAASIEMQGSGYAEIQFGYSLAYSSMNTGQPTGVTLASAFSGAPNWDSFTWDNFVWDGQTLAPTDIDVTGTAENIQVTIASGTNFIPAYTINSIIHHYTPRRGIRP